MDIKKTAKQQQSAARRLVQIVISKFGRQRTLDVSFNDRPVNVLWMPTESIYMPTDKFEEL